MGRVRGNPSGSPGHCVPGVYRALLEFERVRYERRGGEPVVIDGVEIGKKTPAGRDEHGRQAFFLYPRRGFLNSLEAGETVEVGVGWVEDALWQRDRKQDSGSARVRLPFARGGCRRVRVSPDDLVEAVVIP